MCMGSSTSTDIAESYLFEVQEFGIGPARHFRWVPVTFCAQEKSVNYAEICCTHKLHTRIHHQVQDKTLSHIGCDTLHNYAPRYV